jgi:DNA-directed RNA polymerase specialized sigma24 family protein
MILNPDPAKMRNVDADALVAKVVAGDEAAWRRLWSALEPRLSTVLRRPSFLGRISDSEDDCRSVVVDVMERLRAEDFRRLRLYLVARQEQPGLSFVAWVLVVAKRAGIDYMRRHGDYVDRRREEGASSPGAWRVIETLLVHSRTHGERPAMTDRAAAHEILAQARELPEGQRNALRGWLEGRTFAEIAEEQKLAGARDAEKAVRAALERLRRRHRAEEAQ